MCKKHARLVTKQVLLFIVGETLEFCTFITLLKIMNELEIFLNFNAEKKIKNCELFGHVQKIEKSWPRGIVLVKPNLMPTRPPK